MATTALAATGTAFVLAAAVLTSAPAEAQTTKSSARVISAQGQLRDLQLSTAGPFDQARASVVMIQRRGRTLAILHVRGIDRAAAGKDFGAHLHVGPCVTGDGAAAGPHYNADTAAGRVPPRVSPTTEIWLDFVVSEAGTGFAITGVPFVPGPGNRAIVIHQEPTNPQGAAGPRQACVPVSW